ncbi:hypothetical protein D8674_013049 [Pyrus ussuriensis x Pyrus communis]|uniref:Uncharacterized protein n=1 Tax=Pyrus ussuriensis x Pyrus communis TaxID=2448454 RepID=A0A5N5GVI8_9ROSA|nr:hypothetical protein D8674_013049 [Pyrus ussuriensis x Pyrus communis]
MPTMNFVGWGGGGYFGRRTSNTKAFWELTGFGFHRNSEVKQVARESTPMMESLEDICSPSSSNLLHLARAKDHFSLFSSSFPCRTDKCRLFSQENVKRIKANTLASLIAIMELTVNKGGKKRSSPSAQEMLVKKKLKTSSAAREVPPAIERPVIDMTSSNGKKNKTARSEPVAPAMSRMDNSIVDLPKSVPRRPLGAKSGSHLERLAIMKSNEVDSAAKVALRPIPFTVETDSPAGKEETVRVGRCEKSTKLTSRETVEICVLLKPNLLEDIDACANKVAKEVVKTMVVEAYSSADEIKRLDSELVFERINESLKKKVDELQCVFASIGEVVEEVGAQARAAGGEALDNAAAKNVATAEGMAIEDHLVRCFGPHIALRISRRGHVLLDAILLEELRHTFAHELRTIVSDDRLWDVKSANDVPPHEVLYVRLSRGHLGLCFYPFGEIVGCHDHHASTPSSMWHKSYQVNCPLHKWPRARMQV